MSKRIKEHRTLLRKLCNCYGKERMKLLKKNCSKSFILCICECAKNILKGNVAMNSRQSKELRRRKHMLRSLALKRTSLSKKKKIIQTGGFLGALLRPIVSIIGKLFSE
jgi:hypothetical protein